MKKVYIKVFVNLQNVQETALFSGKIYTVDKKFTRPPVATVATNSKSEQSDMILFLGKNYQAASPDYLLRCGPTE